MNSGDTVQKVNTLIQDLSKKKELENTLMTSFLEAQKDDKFKNLTEKLKLPIEELSKYTSILEECSIEYDHCKHCKGLAACKNKIEGHAYLPKVHNKNLEFGYTSCKYKEKLESENKYLKNIYAPDIPMEIRNARMKNIYMEDKNRFETIKWLKSFIENYNNNPNQKGLYLYGNFGCGKTYLISAMLNELAKRKVRSGIIFWPDFLRNLKSKFTSGYEEEIEKIKKLPILCIDDIGAETTTTWSRDEVLCPIVQYRMQEHLPTIFTSNLDYEVLEQHFSVTKDGVEKVKARRVVERIKQLTEPIEMVSENLRK